MLNFEPRPAKFLTLRVCPCSEQKQLYSEHTKFKIYMYVHCLHQGCRDQYQWTTILK